MNMEPDIISLDIKLPIKTFNTKLTGFVDDWNSKFNTNFATKVTTTSTKMGKTLYKVEIKDTNTGNCTEVLAHDDQNTGDIHFEMFKLSNIAKGFYTVSDNIQISSNEQSFSVVIGLLLLLAEEENGTFAYVGKNDKYELIRDGTYIQNCALGIIDYEGNIYSRFTAFKATSFADDDYGSNFTIKVPIKEWLMEHEDVRKAIKGLPLDQQMNTIGKYLIQCKINQEIDSGEFMDIFCQAGILGFSDSSVLNIYKLIM